MVGNCGRREGPGKDVYVYQMPGWATDGRQRGVSRKGCPGSKEMGQRISQTLYRARVACRKTVPDGERQLSKARERECPLRVGSPASATNKPLEEGVKTCPRAAFGI